MDKRSKQPTVEENLNYIVANMATKDDIQEVRSEMATGFQEVRSEMEDMRKNTDEKFDKMFIAIDNLSNKIEFDQSEKSALIIQVQRNREWLNLIAEKVGVPQPA